jgi:ABC-2 type transport system permease protein
MNTQSNAMNGSALDSTRVAPAVLSATRPMYWSVRREVWEYRSIYVAPLVAAGVFLFGFVISLPHRMHALAGADPAKQHEALVMPYDYAAGLIMATALIVSIFYCLEALHGERRDRTILFWKSLPVSDLTTVLSKATVPFVIVPLLAFVVTVVTQFIMLLLNSAVLAANGMSVAMLWTHFALIPMSLMLLYHLVTVHVLWHAPIYAWMMLVSAWARRATLLWATLPVLAIAALERLLFNTHYFGSALVYRWSGGAEAMPAPGDFPIDPRMQLTPGHFLGAPGLWIGLLLAAGFLLAAARLRRYQGPI